MGLDSRKSKSEPKRPDESSKKRGFAVKRTRETLRDLSRTIDVSAKLMAKWLF